MILNSGLTHLLLPSNLLCISLNDDVVFADRIWFGLFLQVPISWNRKLICSVKEIVTLINFLRVILFLLYFVTRLVKFQIPLFCLFQFLMTIPTFRKFPLLHWFFSFFFFNLFNRNRWSLSDHLIQLYSFFFQLFSYDFIFFYLNLWLILHH